MRFFFINVLKQGDPKFYYSENRPRGLGVKNWRMADGARIAHEWPSELPTITPSESGPAVKLPSLIPTTLSYLIVDTQLRDVIKSHCDGADIEYLPLVLLSHKKKVQSTDYCFVNPIGAIDCLDLSRSKITYSTSAPGEVVGVDKFVIDAAKAKDAPALFRIKEDPGEYVVKEPLARAFAEHDFTNLFLIEVETTNG
jgi:hypothetical protein